MTYSQRMSGGASLSDLLYLEQQIEQIKEERSAAVDQLKQYEQEWRRIQSGVGEGKEGAETGDEQSISKKLKDTQTQVSSLTRQLDELEAALDELVD
ncbi:hypothetical protein PAECIP112173_01089 [Paenibacillus sp. JJ-100]|uniref:hypothetical protein n=1 Tax=Paenibacillus sp. JJ-100 TaxID=2974896 RepID=UPI0022FFA0D5|nr:hypothetical protein [Paenibacillus sp. JJ-100]CAI6043091.1 hypothetical protein PAECIP112173_01089 [Paenibacillus sp. JJ-100]